MDDFTCLMNYNVITMGVLKVEITINNFLKRVGAVPRMGGYITTATETSTAQEKFPRPPRTTGSLASRELSKLESRVVYRTGTQCTAAMPRKFFYLLIF